MEQSIAKLVLEKQEKDKEKANKEHYDRLSACTERLVKFLSEDGISVEDTEDVLQGLLKGIERCRIIKAQPIAIEMSKKSFKELYEESIKKPE